MWIAVIVLIGAGVAFTLASLRRPVYEATALVRFAGDRVDADRVEYLRPLLENRAIAGELIREFGITSDPVWTFLSGSGPANTDAFLGNHLDVRQIPNTNLLRVSVRLGNAELAAKVANQLVERGNALDRRMSQDVIDMRDHIKTQLDEADKRLEILKADMLTLKQKTRADTKSAPDARTPLLELHAAIDYERLFLTYADLSTKYEDVRIRIGSGAQFQFVDPAVASGARISPRVMMITQLGGLLALLVGCLLVLARHFLYRHRLR